MNSTTSDSTAELSYAPRQQVDFASPALLWSFHLMNLIAHCAAAVMVFMIVRRIVKNDLAAAVGAALFAVHPIQVEAVAWISGLKDVLAAALGLGAVYLHITAGTSKPRHL